MPQVFLDAAGGLCFEEHALTASRIKPIKNKPIPKDHAVFYLLKQCSSVMFTKQAFIVLFKYVFSGEITILQLFDQYKQLSEEYQQQIVLILCYYAQFFYEDAVGDAHTLQLIVKHAPDAIFRPTREVVVYETTLTFFPRNVEFEYQLAPQDQARRLTPEVAAYYMTQQIAYFIQKLGPKNFEDVWAKSKAKYYEFLLRLKEFAQKWNAAKEPRRALIFLLDTLKWLRQLNNFPAVAALLSALYESTDEQAFQDYQDTILLDQDPIQITLESISVSIDCSPEMPSKYQKYVSDVYKSVGMEFGKTQASRTYLFTSLNRSARCCLQQVYEDRKSRLSYLNSMLQSVMPVFYDADLIAFCASKSDEEAAICNCLRYQMHGRCVNYRVDDNLGQHLFRFFD